MCYIYRLNIPVPQAKTVITDHNVNIIFPDNTFQPPMFGKNMINEPGYFEKEGKILRKVFRIYRIESREINTGNAGDLSAVKSLMFLPGTDNNVKIQFPQLICQGYHPCGMAQSPFKRADKYIWFGFQG